MRRALAAAAATLVLVGCGETPVGPDVRGMALPEAKSALEQAGVGASVVAEDTFFGVIVEENFVVCNIEAVNETMVLLEVAKRGC